MKTKIKQKYVIIGFVLIVLGIIVNTFFNRRVNMTGEISVSKEAATGFLSTLVEEVVYVYEKPSEIFKTEKQKMKTNLQLRKLPLRSQLPNQILPNLTLQIIIQKKSRLPRFLQLVK